ncbi:MAG: hypothetical protein QOJ70_3808 [Acidobacteriota bacterium]|nr:hypothetical protein [Acidobacteriota bacterium]
MTQPVEPAVPELPPEAATNPALRGRDLRNEPLTQQEMREMMRRAMEEGRRASHAKENPRRAATRHGRPARATSGVVLSMYDTLKLPVTPLYCIISSPAQAQRHS